MTPPKPRTPRRAGGLRIWAVVAGLCALAALGVALVGVVVLALRAPFAVDAPRRVFATHVETVGHSAIALRAFDALPLDADLAGVEGVRAPRAGWHPSPPYFPEATHEVDAEVPPIDLPRVDVLGSRPEPGDERTVTLRVASATPHLLLSIPRQRLLGWSLGPELPAEPAGGDRDLVLFIGTRAEGEELSLRLRGAEPVEIELRASAPLPSAALDALLQQLPDHVVWWPETARVLRTAI
ncbi:MAG: hypothetical protein HY908_07965 [Myxococcales bacterium]|nr:hypothetical protein [Myxococcales bacterium]